jgi:hypothetical protein
VDDPSKKLQNIIGDSLPVQELLKKRGTGLIMDWITISGMERYN